MDNLNFIKTNYGVMSNLEISEATNLSIGQVRSLVYKHIPFDDRYRRGKSPHCKPKRKFNLNDDKFSEYSIESCYWAGLMAADGHISLNYDSFSIGLKESDKEHVEKFKNWLEFEGPIRKAQTNYTYNGENFTKYSYSIKPTSSKIVKDLENNFGIGRQKTLTINPPVNILDDIFMDSFIIGYIDGDGCIGTDSDRTTRFSIVGTYEMISWINFRFENILGRKLPTPRKFNNVWVIEFRNKISRELLKHLFLIDSPKMTRKWTDEIRDLAFNYKKSRNIDNYKEILKLLNLGKTKTEISKILKVSPSAITWITKQELFKKLIKESADRDNNEENIDEEN